MNQVNVLTRLELVEAEIQRTKRMSLDVRDENPELAGRIAARLGYLEAEKAMAELRLAGFDVTPPNVRGAVPEINVDQSSLGDEEILELIRGLGIIGRQYWGTIVHLDNLRRRDVARVVHEIKAICPTCEIAR